LAKILNCAMAPGTQSTKTASLCAFEWATCAQNGQHGGRGDTGVLLGDNSKKKSKKNASLLAFVNIASAPQITCKKPDAVRL
jgi:hypothetical protein